MGSSNTFENCIISNPKNMLLNETHKEEFLIYYLNKETEIKEFSKRNQEILKLIPKLNTALDTVFRNSVPSDRKGITVFMLARLCWRHFESVLLLCMSGHGFSACRILRSMFEKYVDATYLHQNPEQIDDFWDYNLVQINELEGEQAVKQFDSNFRNYNHKKI